MRVCSIRKTSDRIVALSLHTPCMKNSLPIVRYFLYSLKTDSEIIMPILSFTIGITY